MGRRGDPCPYCHQPARGQAHVDDCRRVAIAALKARKAAAARAPAGAPIAVDALALMDDVPTPRRDEEE